MFALQINSVIDSIYYLIIAKKYGCNSLFNKICRPGCSGGWVLIVYFFRLSFSATNDKTENGTIPTEHTELMEKKDRDSSIIKSDMDARSHVSGVSSHPSHSSHSHNSHGSHRQALEKLAFPDTSCKHSECSVRKLIILSIKFLISSYWKFNLISEISWLILFLKRPLSDTSS